MTELIWEGKYKDGKKVAPVRIALPFQTIETINESAADRQKRLSSLFNQREETGEWRNRLIWGDKKYVLPSLLPEFAGKVNLIYIDPPFNVGADFSFTATIPDHPESEEDEITTFVKQPSIIEQKAYRDTWGRGLDSYLQWFYETAVLLRELLAEDGSIYVHLDWHVGHYTKAVLDEVFGYENFRNEIIVKRITKNLQKQFDTIKSLPQGHESIFWYSKNLATRFKAVLTSNPNFELKPEGYWKDFWSNADRPTMRYEILGVTPTSGQWKWSIERAYKAVNNYKNFEKSNYTALVDYWKATNCELEFIRKSKSGKIEHWIEPSESKFVDTLWIDISAYQSGQKEYNTQKSETLLERIIKASSSEGDLVLDCFCGSGTTAAVAEKLNRRWITCDLGRFAIHTTRKRLLGIPDVKPFVVQNLGKYERQQWMQAEFENPQNRLQQENAYRHFIIELYHGKTLDGYSWIHGAKAGRMIHVGSVETPVTVEDIKQTILEFWKLVGKEKTATTNGIDFLGWDFAFDINETAAQLSKSNKVNVKFKKIPREVLEKKAVEQGDIKFYELASLSVKTKIAKNQLTVTLNNFIIPPDDIPEEVRGSITHWSQWIDYWSIDWNYRNDTFHNEWQSYRTKQNPKIELTVSNLYDNPGKYIVLVKVIDILGNDTTKALEIKI